MQNREIKEKEILPKGEKIQGERLLPWESLRALGEEDFSKKGNEMGVLLGPATMVILPLIEYYKFAPPLVTSV